MFAFSGLWERWKAPDGKPLDSFAIITTDPNELAATVHNRMPVILEPRHYTRWLTRDDEEQPPLELLRPCGAETIKAWKVGREQGTSEKTIRLCVLSRCDAPAGASGRDEAVRDSLLRPDSALMQIRVAGEPFGRYEPNAPQ